MISIVKYILVLFSLLITSCDSTSIDSSDTIGDDVEISTFFHFEWASSLNGELSVGNHNNGIIHQDQYIFFGDLAEPAHIYAFDKISGNRLWDYRYDGWDNSDVEENHYYEGIILCITGKRVFGFDIESRTVLWEDNLQARGMLRGTGTASSDGMFYVTADENFDPLGGHTNHILRFDPHSGEMDIVVSYAPDSIGTKSTSPPVYWRDDIIVYNYRPNAATPPQETRQYLVAYDMAAGEELWREPVVDGFASNGLHPPAIYDDRIVITGGGHHIFGFDLETGQQLWKYTDRNTAGFAQWSNTNHLIHGDRVYVNETGEDVTCLDARTGREIWDNIEGGANCSDNMVLYEKENVLVLTSWGYGSVMILDADTGETLHREHRYEDVSYSNDPVYDEETDMFFTSTYQHAVAFKVRRPEG